MLAFPSMLVDAANQAGMAVPPDNTLDNESYDREKFPHWWVFCTLQLGVAMHPGEHWENAKVIAKIPNEDIRTVTPEKLKELGFNSKGW